jgi:hypothetical protein
MCGILQNLELVWNRPGTTHHFVDPWLIVGESKRLSVDRKLSSEHHKDTVRETFTG